MKKGLALLLAASMAVSAFSGAAFAADTAQEKYDALVAKGIFDGFPDGTSRLDEEMTRAQAAKVVFKLLNLEENATAAAVYKDLKDAEWAAGFIGAATEAGILNGRGNGVFAPSEKVTLQELAKIMVEALDLEVDEDATVEGADDWAAKYVAAALEAKVIAQSSDYTKAATRTDLVVSAYEVEQAIIDLAAEVTVNENNTVTVSGTSEAEEVSIVIGDAEAVAVEVVDGAFEYTTEKALAAGVHTVTISAEGATSVEAEVEVEAPDYSAAVVGAKKIEVKFGQAVDTSKVAISLKKGSTPINLAKAPTFSEDKTSAVIETSTNLTKGDYTVTTTGVSADALTTTVNVAEDQKVAKIEFQSDKAALVRGNSKQIEINYTITNQYGEKINEDANVTFTYTKGNAGATGSSGKLTLTSGVDYTLNEQVTVYALHNSGVFAQQTFTVAPVAQVASVDIVGLYNKDGKTPTAGEDPTIYAVEVVAKDQYGRDVSESLIDNDTIVTVSNPAVFDVTKGENAFVKENDKVLLKLAAPTGGGNLKAGKATVLIMSKITGNQDSVEVEVKEAQKVASLTLSTPEIIVAGETVKIPFTAQDQNGNALGKAKDFALLSAIDLNSSATTAGKLDWKVDYVKDEVTLELNVNNMGSITTATPSFISGIVNNQIVQMQITINPVKKPLVITGLKDIATAIAKDGKVTVKHENIQIVDQYSRTKTLKDFAGYYVDITSATPANVSVSGDVYQTGVTSVDVSGVKSGTSTFTFKLVNASDNKVIENSDFTTTFRTVTVADIDSYEVSVVDTVYAGGTNYKKELKVEGKLADGSKVAVPVGNVAYYTVSETTTGLEYVTADGKGYLQADATADVENGKEKAYGFAVIGQTKNGAQIETKEVTVSKVAPVITTLELTDDGANIRKVSDGYAKIKLSAATTTPDWTALAEELVNAKDQYGVAVAGNVVATAIPAGLPADLSDLKVQDTFSIVVGTANGKYQTIKVIVVENTNW